MSRLILDSPLPLRDRREGRRRAEGQGQQAALDAFAAQCSAAPDCPLGSDPKGAVDTMLQAARDGRRPSGASVATLADAITTALAFPRGDRASSTNSLASTLAAAGGGDDNQLNSLITQAETLRQSDGQFVNSCSDAEPSDPDRVRELVVAWDKLYPQFGTVGALSLVKCLNWPSGSPPQDPKDLKIPVLLLGVQNDPIVGNEGVAAVAATIINAGAQNRRVMWQGIGHGAIVYTPCAMPPVLAYLDTGNLPPTDTYCPA